MDDVCVFVCAFGSRVVSLQAWKTQHLTARGLRALANLPDLQDLDVGWA